MSDPSIPLRSERQELFCARYVALGCTNLAAGKHYLAAGYKAADPSALNKNAHTLLGQESIKSRINYLSCLDPAAQQYALKAAEAQLTAMQETGVIEDSSTVTAVLAWVIEQTTVLHALCKAQRIQGNLSRRILNLHSNCTMRLLKSSAMLADAEKSIKDSKVRTDLSIFNVDEALDRLNSSRCRCAC